LLTNRNEKAIPDIYPLHVLGTRGDLHQRRCSRPANPNRTAGFDRLRRCRSRGDWQEDGIKTSLTNCSQACLLVEFLIFD